MKPPNHDSGADERQDMSLEPNNAGLPDAGDTPQEVADELLIHALLTGRLQDTPHTMSRRVEEARRAFEKSPSRLWRHWRVGLSTAAAAVIVVGLLLIISSPRNVRADFDQILEAFAVGDKTYQIDISEDSYQPIGWGPRRGRRRIGRRQPFWVPRLKSTPQHLDGALLYIRDRQYVLVCTTPAGQQITKGYDGQQGWLIGPGGGSRTSVDPNLLQRDIPEDIASLLFLDLRDTLHQVEKNYQLSEPTDWTLRDNQKHVLCYVAERVTRNSRLPRRIELWVDAETNQLDHIICAGLRAYGPAKPHTLRIDLVTTDPLPANWFTQAAHLAQ